MTTPPVLPADNLQEAQRASALRTANVRRLHAASLRRAVRTGELDLHDLLDDPDALPRDTSLFDLARDVPGLGPSQLVRLNQAAIRDKINLALPVRRASARSRRWLAHAADHHRTGRWRGPRPVRLAGRRCQNETER